MQTGPENIPERLKELRTAQGLSVSKFAKLAGLSPDQLLHYERGYPVSAAKLFIIAYNLKVNPAWLHYGSSWADKDVPWDTTEIDEYMRF